MTNQSNADAENKEGLKHKPTETSSDLETEGKQDSSHPRRAGLSKREIMEELSRARFPWDDE